MENLNEKESDSKEDKNKEDSELQDFFRDSKYGGFLYNNESICDNFCSLKPIKVKEKLAAEENDQNKAIKRRGGSLARTEFNRENSYSKDKFQTGDKRHDEKYRKASFKRISTFDNSRNDTTQTNSSKIFSFIKSGLSLSKTKSKSRANLEYSNFSPKSLKPSKSEESLGPSTKKSRGSQVKLQLGGYDSPISAKILNINEYDDLNLYARIINSKDELENQLIFTLDTTCIVEMVHPSLVNGRLHCFQIIKKFTNNVYKKFKTTGTNDFSQSSFNSQISKSYSYNSSIKKGVNFDGKDKLIVDCSNWKEKYWWIKRLKTIIHPEYENSWRTEDSLKIWIQEAKNLTPKKKYLCEVKLDNVIYARTTIKTMTDSVFWGEIFELKGLHKILYVSICLYKVVEVKKKKDKQELIAELTIPFDEIENSTNIERWYITSTDMNFNSKYSPNTTNHDPVSLHSNKNIESNNINPPDTKDVASAYPTIRIKTCHKQLNIGPIVIYNKLLKFIRRCSINLTKDLELHLKVKAKEEFVSVMIPIMMRHNIHKEYLAQLVTMEALESDDESMILRGNSMASKAIETYLKIVGKEFLDCILKDVVTQIISKDFDCEVNPNRVTSNKHDNSVVSNQKQLIQLVESVWNNIMTSYDYFPNDLKDVFVLIRKNINSSDFKKEGSKNFVLEHILSSCIFLRYICPAIMSPFLFGLTSEYITKSSINRTFTLIAKCIQSLANLSQLWQGKEDFMKFLDTFLKENYGQMLEFLNKISQNDEDYDKSINKPIIGDQNDFNINDFEDMNYYLAELSSQLTEYLKEIQTNNYTAELSKVQKILQHQNDNKNPLVQDLNQFNNTAIKYDNYKVSPSLIPTLKPRAKTNSDNYKSMIKSSSSGQYSNRKEEDFSYIPGSTKMKTNTIDAKFKNPTLFNDNYVDFESFKTFPVKSSNETKMLETKPSNQKSQYLSKSQIDTEWNQILQNINMDKNNSKKKPDLNYSFSENLQPLELSKTSTLYTLNNSSTSFSSKRPANIIKRIQKINLTNQSIFSQNNNEMYTQKDLTLSNLSLSKSLNSLNPNNSSNTDIPNNFESSQNSIDINSYDIKSIESASYTSMDDLIQPIINNEFKRLSIFIKIYKMDNEVLNMNYNGNAVENYRQRTRDEEILKKMYLIDELQTTDIRWYLPACSRILKNIYESGNIATDKALEYIIKINKMINESSLISNSNSTDNQAEIKFNAENKTQKNLFRKTHREESILSTRSLPVFTDKSLNGNEKKIQSSNWYVCERF